MTIRQLQKNLFFSERAFPNKICEKILKKFEKNLKWNFISQSKTTKVAGDYVHFGDDIGYTTSGCSMGYWPPGPVCAAAQNDTDAIASFTLLPAVEGSSGCYTGHRAQGLLVNGAALFGWSDSGTYNSSGVQASNDFMVHTVP
jgi:hypothetical protein